MSNLSLILLVNSVIGDYTDLNSCFVYKKGYRLELSANDIESTESVEFKDDCLRSCLRSLLSGGFICRSLMHMPKDEVRFDYINLIEKENEDEVRKMILVQFVLLMHYL